MQSRTSNILTTIVLIILTIDLMVFSFASGVYLSSKTENENYVSVGCWKKVTETNRAIAIRVEKRDIEEILDTARHEICHEIHYRLNRETFKDLPKERREKFADECNPEDYLEVK